MPDFFSKEPTNDEIAAKPDGAQIFNDKISKIDKDHKDDCEKSYNSNPNKINNKTNFNELSAQEKYEYLLECSNNKKSDKPFIGSDGGKRRSIKRNQKKSKKNHKKRNQRKSRRHRRQ